MIGPPRLLDVSGDDLERRLLDSVRYDRAPAEAEARCVAAVAAAVIVGSQIALVSTAAATTTASAVSTSATVSSAAASIAAAVTTAATTTGLAVAVKAVAIGLTVGLAAQGTFAVAKHLPLPPTVMVAQSQRALPSAQMRPRSIALLPLVPSISSTVVEGSVLPRKISTPPPVIAAPSRAPERIVPEPAAVSHGTYPSPTVASRTGSEDVLEREVAILDGARQACGVGNYSVALAQLEHYEAEFPAGALAPEALVVHVRALLGLGRRSEAEALAKRHIAAQPNSAMTRRLGVIMGWSSP